MTKLKPYLYKAAVFLGLVFVGLIVAGLAAPFISDSLKRIRAEFPSNAGTSGLIYVESPEVYTRQRLVNDRYLQDAWLRDQLDVIDQPTTSWIDTERIEVRKAELNLGKTDGAQRDPDQEEGEEGETAEGVAASDVSISFTEKFKLQSNARDKIRQMILENALDDRHDLSGNTVFGLKFDTSVLPGSRTTLNPTVIVRMDANPLDRFENPHRFAPFFNKSTWSERESFVDADIVLLEESEDYYDNWVRHLEARLNKQRSAVTLSSFGPSNRDLSSCLLQPLCAATETQEPQYVIASETDPSTRLAPNAESAVRSELRQRHDVDAALRFVLRIPERSLTFHNQILERYRHDAIDECAPAPDNPEKIAPADFKLENLFFKRNRSIGHEFALPGDLAPFFDLRVDPRIPSDGNDCELDLDIHLKKKEMPLLLLSGEAAKSPHIFSIGLRKIDCATWFCDEKGMQVWVPDDHFPAALAALDDPTLDALFPKATIDALDPESASEGVWELCTTESFYFDRKPGEDAMGWDGLSCAPGLIATFKVGPYHFLRKMSAVESYIYAAFPRGDVSGVVSKVTTGVSATGSVSSGYGPASVGLSDTQEESSIAAVPSLINFASGDQHELFDFGWSIVQDGIKEPMIASQLVLISVPAYLKELRLEIVKGFLDVNEMPSDWTEWRNEFRDLTDPETEGETGRDPVEVEKERNELLAQRVDRLFDGWESRTIELKVPPDYRSLDGILFGTSDLGGPLINTADISAPGCYDYDQSAEFVLPIPGDRLWRSTVVTLDGQRASKIEVLPDMRGILATFKPTVVADDQGAGSGPARPTKVSATSGTTQRRLTVWTSEGNNSATIDFCANR